MWRNIRCVFIVSLLPDRLNKSQKILETRRSSKNSTSHEVSPKFFDAVLSEYSNAAKMTYMANQNRRSGVSKTVVGGRNSVEN
jgi:hypothetical protein